MVFERHYFYSRAGMAPGAAVYAPVLGHLDAFAADRHHTVLDECVPHVVMRGSGVVQSPHEHVSIKAGDLFCLWPGVTYELGGDGGAPWELYWFHLRGSGAQDYAQGLGFRRDQCHVRPRDKAGVLQVMQDCAKLYQQTPSSSSTQLLAPLIQLVDLCGGDARSDQVKQDDVGEAVSLMRASLSTKININDICDILGIHRVTLARLFKQRLSCSPLDYLIRLRLERTTELLTSTGMTIEDIATMVGFTDGKHLMKRFKLVYAMTPGQWRETHKQSESE